MTLPRRVSAVVLMLALACQAPAATHADANCAPGQLPVFRDGFADLSSAVGPAMGQPITCEYADPGGSGDVEQNTTTGLAYWRKATNTPSFTDGFTHWALMPNGLVQWTGASADPPPDATPLAGSPVSVDATPVAPSPVPTADVTAMPAPTGQVPVVLTNASSGQTVQLTVGQQVNVDLQASSGMALWEVQTPDPSVLTPIVNPAATAIRGATLRAFQAVGVGTTTLVATDRPVCNPGQMCPQFIQQWSVTIQVTG